MPQNVPKKRKIGEPLCMAYVLPRTKRQWWWWMMIPNITPTVDYNWWLKRLNQPIKKFNKCLQDTQSKQKPALLIFFFACRQFTVEEGESTTRFTRDVNCVTISMHNRWISDLFVLFIPFTYLNLISVVQSFYAISLLSLSFIMILLSRHEGFPPFRVTEPYNTDPGFISL